MFKIWMDENKLFIEQKWRHLFMPPAVLFIIVTMPLIGGFRDSKAYTGKQMIICACIQLFSVVWMLIAWFGKTNVTISAEFIISKDNLFPIYNSAYKMSQVKELFMVNLFSKNVITDRTIVIKFENGQNDILFKGDPEEIKEVHSQISKFMHDKKIDVLCTEEPFDKSVFGNH
jgi:hypothetical protein